jgi:hypothetical protein
MSGLGPGSRMEAPVLLPQLVDSCVAASQQALASRNAAGMVAAILELD